MIELREKILSAIIDKSSLKQRVFDNTFAIMINQKFWVLEAKDPNAMYYESDFNSNEEMTEYGIDLVKRVESEGAALLKNDNNTLPIKENEKIAVIGPLADTKEVIGAWGGKGEVKDCISLVEALKEAKHDFNYALGSNIHSTNQELIDQISNNIEYVKESVKREKNNEFAFTEVLKKTDLNSVILTVAPRKGSFKGMLDNRRISLVLDGFVAPSSVKGEKIYMGTKLYNIFMDMYTQQSKKDNKKGHFDDLFFV